MCSCACVPACARVHVGLCACVPVCPCVCPRVQVGLPVCACTCACVPTCAGACVCTCAYVHVCIRVHVHACNMYAYVACAHVCVWVPMCLHVVETVFQCPPNSLGTLVSSPGKAGVQSDPHLCSSGHRVPRMFPGRQNQQLPFPKPHSHFQSAGGTSEVVSGRPPGEDPWVFQETAGSG